MVPLEQPLSAPIIDDNKLMAYGKHMESPSMNVVIFHYTHKPNYITNFSGLVLPTTPYLEKLDLHLEKPPQGNYI